MGTRFADREWAARVCTSCGDIKPIREFPVTGTWRGTTYHRHICRCCFREANEIREAAGLLPGMRRCLQCNGEFPVDSFPVARTCLGGVYYRHSCQRCYQYVKQLRIARIRLWVQLYKSKHGCCHCDNHDYRVLDFHHRDRGRKKFCISAGVATRSWSKLSREIKKCDILCANCHRVEHWQQREEAKKTIGPPPSIRCTKNVLRPTGPHGDFTRPTANRSQAPQLGKTNKKPQQTCVLLGLSGVMRATGVEPAPRERLEPESRENCLNTPIFDILSNCTKIVLSSVRKLFWPTLTYRR